MEAKITKAHLGDLGMKEMYVGMVADKEYTLVTVCNKYGSIHYVLEVTKNKKPFERLEGEAFYAFPFLAVEVDEDETDGNLAYLSTEWRDEKKNTITFRIGETNKHREQVKIVRYHEDPNYHIDLTNTPTLRKK